MIHCDPLGCPPSQLSRHQDDDGLHFWPRTKPSFATITGKLLKINGGKMILSFLEVL